MFFQKSFLSGAFTFIVITAAQAADPDYAPLLKASEARFSAPASETFTVVSPSNFTMRTIRIDGKSYRQTQDGPWTLMPVDIAESERQFFSQIASGAVKVTNCHFSKDETVNGIVSKVFNYTVEMPGAPAAAAKLYIGKSDGLPYLQTGEQTKTTFSYVGLKAPKM